MRHIFTHEDRQKGGKNQPREAKVEGGQKGFQTTMERYPHMARKYLRYAPGMKKYKEGKFTPQ